MSQRIAQLYNEDGVLIYEGVPADMPIQFVTKGGLLINTTMREATFSGIPIDPEDGDDLKIAESNQ